MFLEYFLFKFLLTLQIHHLHHFINLIHSFFIIKHYSNLRMHMDHFKVVDYLYSNQLNLQLCFIFLTLILVTLTQLLHPKKSLYLH